MRSRTLFGSVRRYCTTGKQHLVGLFRHAALTSPGGFLEERDRAIADSELIIEKINLSDSPQEIVQGFDDLSDTICRVADLSECIRLVHPDPRYVECATQACSDLGGYVESLNTNTSLHTSLKKVVDSPSYSSMDEETRRNIASLMHDFEISGIRLSGAERERVLELNKTILQLSHIFFSCCNDPVIIHKNHAPQIIQEHYPHSKDDKDIIVVDHVSADDNESLRLYSYMIYNNINTQQLDVLEKLLAARYELAQLVGYRSFAHRSLKETMGGSPEVVQEFMQLLNKKLRPFVAKEMEKMAKMKEQYAMGQYSPQLHLWDLQWLTSRMNRHTKHLEQYLSLDNCMAGIRNLFWSLFGVKVREEPVENGEVWHNSVRKYVFECNRETLGIIYCDFFSRNGKTATNCQFTIQGGKQLQDNTYQIPISALSLAISSEQDQLLSQCQVETLFHEMGHALHSVLGRPRYQNIAGTRCATDFAEVPSNLMELFLKDEKVLSSFARHCATGNDISKRELLAFKLSNNAFPAIMAQQQLLYSAMDQQFHAARPLEEPIIKQFSDIYQQYLPFNFVEKTAPFLRFSHFYQYAGKYYSYLWARSVANLIYQWCFRDDPFSRDKGELYRWKMLRYGGGMHPSVLVEQVLGYSPSVDNLVNAYCQEIEQIHEEMDTVELWS